jgi:hypothetical protein
MKPSVHVDVYLARYIDIRTNIRGSERVSLGASSAPAVIFQVGARDRVIVMTPKTSKAAGYCELVVNHERTTVEQDVMIRAKAEDVVDRVGPVVRSTERTNVCCLCVGTAGCHKSKAADLAMVTVELLDV